MLIPTVNEMIEALNRLGHKVFINGDYNLNLIGIRKDYQASNRFDDTMVAFYKVGGRWQIDHWPVTTDPGWYYLENGLSKGTAILKEGQYRGAYRLGLHKGQYKALVQAKPVTVYRDANKDHRLDTARTETGLFGINIHRAGQWAASAKVDKWSAGCQVFADPDDFMALLSLARRSADLYGPDLTYTLIKESDL